MPPTRDEHMLYRYAARVARAVNRTMFTTLTRAVKLITLPKDSTEVRVTLLGWFAGATEARVRLIESKTPRAFRADHRRAAAITETTAKAIDRTNVVFI